MSGDVRRERHDAHVPRPDRDAPQDAPGRPDPGIGHVVLMGVSGAGKTTVGTLLAQRMGRDFLDADDLHPPANLTLMRAGTPLTDADRVPWLDAVGRWLEDHAGPGAVVACSALRKEYRAALRRGHLPVRFVLLDPGPEAVARRLTRRTGHFMPPSLLASQYETLQPLLGADGITVTLDASAAEVAEEVLRRLGSFRPPAGR